MGDAKKISGGAITATHVHITATTFAVALAAAAWLFGIAPALEARAQAIEQRQALTLQKEQNAELNNQITLAERRINVLMQEERQSPLRLDDLSQTNQRLSQLSELAARYKLDVSVIKPGLAQSLARFERVPIRLEGNGTFQGSAAFLHGMNRAFPDMGVASVKIDHQPNSELGQANFAFTLVWYAAPAGSEAPTPAEPAQAAVTVTP